MDTDKTVSLCLDLGNSLHKLAVFTGNTLVKSWTVQLSGLQECLQENILPYHPRQSILCSVINHHPETEHWLSGHTRMIRLDHLTALPFINAYEHPSTLGPDRIALAAGAAVYYAGRHTLIIGTGTCITFNFVSQGGEFLGGSISPGLHMRLEALHTFTGRLPKEKISPLFPLIGYNTRQSILSGALGGAIAEVDGLIGRYQERYEEMQVVLTGGDMLFFERHLKSKVLPDPDLLVRGLLAILQLNNP